MKQFLLSGMFFICSSAFAAMCVPGTLLTYVNLGSTGCQDGNVVIFDHMWSK